MLQTLLRIPVDLKRIAASKIGHLVMKLHTTGGEATSGGGGGASAISLQIQEIYKTATRVVTLWKDTKAKTAGDASAAAIDSNKSGASTSSSSSSSQPTPLPLMATLSSSSKHSKSSATMVIDDDVVEASKKRPRSSSAKGISTEEGGKGNSSSSSSSSSSTTTTSKKSKTEGEFIYKENNKYCRRSMLKFVYQIEKNTTPPLYLSLFLWRSLYTNNNMMKNKYIIDLGLFPIGPEMNDR